MDSCQKIYNDEQSNANIRFNMRRSNGSFVQFTADRSNYAVGHFTPNGQRLQLSFDDDGHACVAHINMCWLNSKHLSGKQHEIVSDYV